MGTILTFTRQNAAARPGIVPTNTSGAAIIIFPGVRYERTTDIEDRPDNRPSTGRGPRRSRRNG